MMIHYDPHPRSKISAVVFSAPQDRAAKADDSTLRPSLPPARDTPAHYAPASHGIYRKALKRGLDIILVLLAAPLVVLSVAVLALGIALEGGHPFYSQPRIGRNGRVYRMWKLRSMVVDADARLESYLAQNPAARAEWDSTQKLKSDPRITRFGRLLRKSSLDELPQLWNVLIGDMSLVGPRPMMPCQQDIYPGTAYYRLRPGITGPWQVSRRNESTFADRARFDLDYEQNLSLTTDLRLLIKTVRVVVHATGY